MLDEFETLLEEENIISLRRAVVMDDGSTVTILLMPVDISALRPKGRRTDWVYQDYANLYRHMLPPIEEEKMLRSSHRLVLQGIKPLAFEKPPQFRLLWTDSGNSVAVFINGEPWAFIDEETHTGYSKGHSASREPAAHESSFSPNSEYLELLSKLREAARGVSDFASKEDI